MSAYLENLNFIPDIEAGGGSVVLGFPGHRLLPFISIFQNDILSKLYKVSNINLKRDLYVFREGIGCSPGVFTKEDGSIDWDIIKILHDSEKATLYIRALQRYIPEINELCQHIEADFKGVRVFANLFATPPHAIGLKPHLDPTEFFVVQINGSKKWSFWRQPSLEEFRGLSLRARAEFALEIATQEDKHMDIELCEGQAMYVPRFKIHGPCTGNQFSTHVTVGLATDRMREYYD